MKKILSCLMLLVIIGVGGAGFYFVYLKPKIQVYLEGDNLAADLWKGYSAYHEGKEDGFAFAVIGDTEMDNHEIGGVLKKAVEEINNSQVKFVVHSGDFASSDNEEEYRQFKDYMDKNLKVPYYIVAGNHDVLQEWSDTGRDYNKERFVRYFDKRYYSFDYEKAHFIILDNSDNTVGFESGQLDWLKEDLRINNGKQIFVFMHRPVKIPLAKEYQISDGESLGALKSYDDLEMSIKNSSVRRIFAGHIHTYFNYYLGDVPLTISGGGGSKTNMSLLENLGSYNHFLEIQTWEKEHTVRVVEIK